MNIQPKLGRFDLIMIIVSMVIGIGIFRTPASVADKAGTPLIFFLVWIIGGIITICGALTFAEIGSRLPVAGGFYKLFQHTYPPAYAFMMGWSFVLLNTASAAGVALIGAEYIAPVFLPPDLQNQNNIRLIAIGVILILFVLNFLGIKMGSRAQNILSLLKIGLILLFCFAVFGKHADENVVATQNNFSGMDLFKAIGVSLIAVFFTYGGYQNTINFGADVKNAQRNLPRAIITGITIIILLYLLINFAYYKVIGFETMKTSPLVAAELARAFVGDWASKFASLVIFVSVLGFLNTCFMSNPRVYFAMANDNILPAVFKKLNARTQVQEFALSFILVLMILSLLLLGTFENILNYVMFIDILSIVSAVATIFILRRRKNAAEHVGYKMKWYPVLPVVFILVLAAVWVNVISSDYKSSLYGFIIFVSGLPLFFISRYFMGRRA